MASIKGILIVLAASALLIAAMAVWVHTYTFSPSLKSDSTDIFHGPLTASEQRMESGRASNTMNPHARINTNYGTFTLELYQDTMPVTAENFIALAESGFYTNTKFHRVIEGFMIQGGDPNTRSGPESTYGTGGPGYTIEDEFVEGELLSNVRGTISMANTGQPDSGGSQFFINLVDNTSLDFNKEPFTSKHPVFGRVIDGMDVVDEIGRVPTKERDIPVEPVVIESIEIVPGA